MGHDPTRGSGQEVFKTRGSSPLGSGRVRRCSKSYGSGRDGMGQVFFKSHGSGRATLTRSSPREVIRPVESPLFLDGYVAPV